MLITMKELLKVASKHHFTIGAFNVTEVSNFKCVFETAEELQAPTIIAVAANELDFCEKEYYQYVREKLMNSQVPYCCLLYTSHLLMKMVSEQSRVMVSMLAAWVVNTATHH